MRTQRLSNLPAVKWPGVVWLAAGLLAVAVSGGCQTKVAPKPVQPLHVGGFMQDWQAPLELVAPNRLTELHLQGDTLYAYTSRNVVFSLAAGSGKILWVNTVGEPGDSLLPPLLLPKNVTVIPCISSLFRFDERGRELPKIEIGHSIRSGLAGAADRVYAGLDYPAGGHVARIDLTKSLNNVVWEFLTNAGVSSAPVLFQNILYVAGENGNVYAVNEARKVVWPLPDGVFKTGDKVLADLKVDAAGLYVPCTDTKLYCLEPATGKIKWQYFANVPLNDAPVVTADSVYQPVPGHGVAAIDKAAGEFNRKPRWIIPNTTEFLAEDASFAYLRTDDNSIIGVDKKSGEAKFENERNDLVAFASNPSGDTIYAATASGLVLGIKPVTRAGAVGQMARMDLHFETVAVAK